MSYTQSEEEEEENLYQENQQQQYQEASNDYSMILSSSATTARYSQANPCGNESENENESQMCFHPQRPSFWEFLSLVFSHLFRSTGQVVIISKGKRKIIRRSIFRHVAKVLPVQLQVQLPQQDSFDILYPMREFYNQYHEEIIENATFTLKDIVQFADKTTTSIWRGLPSMVGDDEEEDENASANKKETPSHGDNKANDKISELEKELARLREQIAMIVTAQQPTEVNCTSSTMVSRAAGAAPPLPPPPPPPPPPPLPPALTDLETPKLGTPMKTRSQMAVQQSNSTAPSKAVNLQDVLKGISSVKLRAVSSEEIEKAKAEKKSNANDFASVIAGALKRKFANAAQFPSGSAEDNSSFSSFDASPARETTMKITPSRRRTAKDGGNRSSSPVINSPKSLLTNSNNPRLPELFKTAFSKEATEKVSNENENENENCNSNHQDKCNNSRKKKLSPQKLLEIRQLFLATETNGANFNAVNGFEEKNEKRAHSLTSSPITEERIAHVSKKKKESKV